MIIVIKVVLIIGLRPRSSPGRLTWSASPARGPVFFAWSEGSSRGRIRTLEIWTGQGDASANLWEKLVGLRLSLTLHLQEMFAYCRLTRHLTVKT